MSLESVIQRFKGSPGSPAEKVGGTAATRIPAGGSPGSPGSLRNNKNLRGKQESTEPRPLSDMGQRALDALALHGWAGESALKVARLIESGETDEDALIAVLEGRT
ncbi:MAG: hypothetical protein PHF20_04575 [Halothiobacillaceae bacterium]|nr:hypothetical protein [Halothiobacillaceae bacterium]